MSWELAEQIIAAAGQPVAGETLSVAEMEAAVAAGRVIEIHFWSSMGESEAGFGFATRFGVDARGRVHPSYLVFPNPIPPALRHRSAATWEEVDDVRAAFGVRRPPRTG